MRGHIFTPKASENIRLLSTVNLFAFPSGVQKPPPPRKCWSIGAIKDIDMSYRLGNCRGSWIQRPRHSVHLIHPRCTCQGNHPANDDAALRSAYLCFTADDVPRLNALLDEHMHAEILDPHDIVSDLLYRCADIAEQRKDEGLYEAQAVLCRILDILVSSELNLDGARCIGPQKSRRVHRNLAYKVREYLGDHIHEVLRLEDIASACDVSVSSLSHRYRELCGETPLTTHSKMRIERAKQLLLYGERVGVIAEQLGYSDAYHFSKQFKKIVGLSPTGFLKQF